MGPMNKRLNFGGDPDYRLHTGIILLRIRNYSDGRYGKCLTDIHSFHTNSPDRGTGKTCIGGGMHCPSASSFLYGVRLTYVK